MRFGESCIVRGMLEGNKISEGVLYEDYATIYQMIAQCPDDL